MEYSSKPLYREHGQKVTKINKKLPKNKVPAKDIKSCGNGIYEVKSQSTKGLTYKVDASACTCTCLVGISGAKCKHQLGVHLHTPEKLINFPTLSLDLMHLFHEIASGYEPSAGYYLSIRNQIFRNNLDTSQTVADSATSSQIQAVGEPYTSPENEPDDVENQPGDVENENGNIELQLSDIENELSVPENESIELEDENDDTRENLHHDSEKLLLLPLKKYKGDPEVRATCIDIFKLMANRLEKSKNAFQGLFYTLRGGRMTKRKFTSTRITPNHTSIARRKNGTNKGKTKARAGRPPANDKNEANKEKTKTRVGRKYKNLKTGQRPHDLKSDVTIHNRAPAKKH